MANSSRTIMTDAGFALETRVRADETKMQFTRAAISTDDHFSDTDDALAKLTELSNIQQDGKVTAVQVINTTTVYVQVDVNQAESKDDYQMRSAALYAKDDDGTEVLYGVTVLQDPVFVHKDADGSYLGFGINTAVGRASNVVVVVDPTNMVTHQVFEGTMKNYYTKAEVDTKFVTDDDFASKLPKNIATTDAANTFAKSQTLAGGATDGKGNAYATTKDVTTGLNNGLSTKVTDNKNGTEQLNGVKVQPFNKLSDTIGGRNYLINTQNPSATNPVKFVGVSSIDTSGTVTFSNGYIKLTSIVSSTARETHYRFILPIPTLIPLPAGTYTLVVDLTSSDNVYVTPRGQYSADGTTAWHNMETPLWALSSIEKQFSYTFTIPSNTTGWYISLEMYADTNGTFDNTGKSFQFRNASIQKGNIATDSSPAPEDKVNVSDMRKPASDVAGIEEVNAKQDKIGYTPADDSKVAHLSGTNNFDTVPTVKNNPLLLASNLPSDLARTGSDQEFTGKNTFDTAPIDKTTGNPYITAKAPGIPKLEVTYNATSKAFDYTLTAPEKDGLSDIIQYNLLWKDHSVDDWTKVIIKPDALTGQLTGVDIKKTYDFKAAAQNAVGPSGFTDVITLPAASVPGIPSLTAEYNAGKKGFDYTVTAPESDGGSEITGYSLEYQKQGGTDWTKVALNPDSLTGTVTDGIEAGSDYLFRVNAENAVGSSNYFTISDPVPTVDGNIYGVSWDGSSSGTLQRTDAAVGLNAGINGAQNDFDTRGPWGLMDKTITDDKGNSFVRIPKLYIKKTQTDKLATWQVSLSKIDDSWYLPKCFWDFTNQKELDYVDVGRYQGTVTDGLLQSKSGVTATASLTIGSFRADARANGDGYKLLDIHVVDVWQVLFLIEFATLDSQSIMHGNLDNGSSGSAKTNGTGSNHAGSSGYATSTGPMDYRGIENMYGNLYQWTDGVNLTGANAWVCDDANKYQSDLFAAPYQALSYTTAKGWISKMGYDSNHPFAQFATVASGSASTYYADYQYTTTGNTVAAYGGCWGGTDSYGGAFYWNLGYSSAYSDVFHGSRLVKKALG